MRVADLRAEYTVDLLGTQVAHPRLSWRIEDAEQQTSYRIRAAASQADLAAGDLLWDSGHVASDATFDIPYGGPALAAMQRVWWTVEVNGAATADPAWFEAGLLSSADWRGDWIEAEDDNAAADRAAGVNWVWGDVSLDARPHAFRIDFDAPADLVRAEVLVAGKDHLRGVWVCTDRPPSARATAATGSRLERDRGFRPFRTPCPAHPARRERARAAAISRPRARPSRAATSIRSC